MVSGYNIFTVTDFGDCVSSNFFIVLNFQPDIDLHHSACFVFHIHEEQSNKKYLMVEKF